MVGSGPGLKDYCTSVVHESYVIQLDIFYEATFTVNALCTPLRTGRKFILNRKPYEYPAITCTGIYHNENSLTLAFLKCIQYTV
jgi:hypothetical protein